MTTAAPPAPIVIQVPKGMTTLTLTPSWAGPVAPPSGKAISGVNNTNGTLYETIRSALIASSPAATGLAAVRTYHTRAQGVPAAFPAKPAGSSIRISSMEPNVAEFTSGKLDTAFTGFMNSGTKGDIAVLYHEPQQVGKITAADYHAVYNHAAGLMSKVTSGVQLWECHMCYEASARMAPYVTNVTDGIALDGYQNPATKTVAQVFGASLTAIETVNKSPKALSVFETNSVSAAARPGWLEAVAGWGQQNNLVHLLTFWFPEGTAGSSISWVPGDTETIKTMATLATP